MHAYAAGNFLADIGFIGAYDMTIEAVIAKLYYLFSCNLSRDEIKVNMQKNLRGELTPKLVHH